MKAKPFIKWVGGKRQLLHELRARIPSEFGTYHEPFVGGGALFFDLEPKRAILSDTNERLVRTYRAVRDSVEQVIATLQTMPHDRDLYMQLRDARVDDWEDHKVAAWFLRMNRSGYNGLYRVSLSGKYNVPFSEQRAPKNVDPNDLRACSDALHGVQIRHAHFAEKLTDVEPGDLVYFDPPYVPLSASSSFTAYTSDGFDLAEQVKLRDVARELKRRGAHILLSNSSAPLVSTLYGRDFAIEHVNAGRSINCDGAKRGRIAESIIR